MRTIRAILQKVITPKFLFIILSYLVIVIWCLNAVISGGIPFWFDPARDLLLALSNFENPTFIGQPTGIPGLFYGPYWIWMLSIAVKISMDPRIVTLLVLTLPYLIFVPIILYLLRGSTGKVLWFILFILYFTAYSSYSIFLWNPHPAFLFTFLLVYLVSVLDLKQVSKKSIIQLFVIGLCVGFILNFHLSFGLGTLLGVFIYFLISGGVSRKNFLSFLGSAIYIYSLITLGILVTYIPFFLFEIRHGLQQLNVIKTLLINASFYDTPLVGQQGLPHKEITQNFINSFFKLLHIKNLNIFVKLFTLFLFIYFLDKLIYFKSTLVKTERTILIFCITCLLSILYIFQSSKYPVWEYHFSGLEVFYLLLIGIIARKNVVIKGIISLIAVIALLNMAVSFFNNDNFQKLSSLKTKEDVTDLIINNSDENYKVYAYSPSIYTFEYDYLFKWKGKDKGKLPSENSRNIYLIIPPSSPEILEDFINYKTPNDKYITIDKWDIPDGTTVLKRKLNTIY